MLKLQSTLEKREQVIEESGKNAEKLKQNLQEKNEEILELEQNLQSVLREKSFLGIDYAESIEKRNEMDVLTKEKIAENDELKREIDGRNRFLGDSVHFPGLRPNYLKKILLLKIFILQSASAC